MIRKPWKERSSELAVVRRRMRDRLFETGQIPRFVGSGDLLPWLPTCLECLYNVSFLRHRCLSPSSFAHWYSHYFQLANTPSVVYPLEISLFLQFLSSFPSFFFLFFSRWKAERWLSWLLPDTQRRQATTIVPRTAPFVALHFHFPLYAMPRTWPLAIKERNKTSSSKGASKGAR